MRITETHVNFWQARKRPKWARPLKHGLSIHACINDHAGIESRSSEPGNTIAILRSAAKRGAFADVLRQCAVDRQSIYSDKRRAWVARWMRRMARG